MFALGGIQSTAFNQVPTGMTSVDQLLYISASMAFSLLFTVWLFARSVALSLRAHLRDLNWFTVQGDGRRFQSQRES